MNTPAPHRKHHLCCAAAHLALAVIALLERSLAVAVAETAIAVAYADMAWRVRNDRMHQTGADLSRRQHSAIRPQSPGHDNPPHRG